MAAHGCNLNNGSKNHDDTTEDNGTATTEQVSNRKDENSAYQTANLVDCCDQTLHGRISSGGEVVVEDRGGNDTAHDTLVIAKEKESSGSDG